ncbi:MAG TPA: hypothetical protein VK115_02725 [Staphylococcus sp.]|nr:hypothetical protein [Staphylococcus sp.]
MYKFLYISLVCGLLAGAGIFLKLPIFPSMAFPVILGVIGIITALITIPDKEINGFLKLGGVLINFMPIMAALTVAQ